MKKYRVIDQRVEINGVTREIGAELTAKDFRPSSGKTVEREDGTKGPEWSELESLLYTKHVEEIK